MCRIKRYFYLSLILLGLLATGCGTPKNIAYFQDVNEETLITTKESSLTIQPNDKLSIIVHTADPRLSNLFNLDIVSDRLGESGSAVQAGMTKYTVSPEGFIDFPYLGSLKVAGMSTDELAGFIKGELMAKDLAKDPIVTVEMNNKGISVLGEVTVPGRLDIDRDKITILDAIASVGDLTVNGKRENVTVIREKDGKINTFKVDLTNFKELATSPVYYLQPGDVVYVEPNDMKKRMSTTNANNVYSTSFWISLASLLTSVVTTIGVFVVK